MTRALVTVLVVLGGAPLAHALPYGGLFGGAVRSNGSSANWNPAALTELGDAWAGLVELDGIAISGAFARDGIDPNTQQPYERVDFFALAPNLSFALLAPTPIPWLHVIAGGFSPLALAVKWPENGPNRYHATESYIVTYGVPVGVVVAPSEDFGFAVAAGPMYGLLDSSYHLDFGAFANGQLPPGSQPLPLEDPQLEGRVRLQATGWNVLGIAGVWARPLKSLRLGFGVVRPFGMTLTGEAQVHSSPSLDQALPGFRIDSNGDLEIAYHMSFQAQAEVEWSPGDWSFAAIWQDQYSHVRASVPAAITNASVEFLNGDQTSVGDIQDELLWGGRVSRRFGDRWELGARVDWLPTSIPTEVMNPGNMDYDMLEFTIGARWRFGDRHLAELSYMYAHGSDVHVTNSVFNPYAPPSSGLASPSANGQYQVSAHLVTLTVLAIGPAAK